MMMKQLQDKLERHTIYLKQDQDNGQLQLTIAQLWFTLGTTQMRDMNIQAAEQSFSKANAIWPDFYASWICSGWCYLLLNELDKAKIAYQQAATLDKEIADAWGGLALVYALQGHLSKAQNPLQQAIFLDPECYMAKITRIILANPSSPEAAARQFNLIFPDSAAEIKRVLKMIENNIQT